MTNHPCHAIPTTAIASNGHGWLLVRLGGTRKATASNKQTNKKMPAKRRSLLELIMGEVSWFIRGVVVVFIFIFRSYSVFYNIF